MARLTNLALASALLVLVFGFPRALAAADDPDVPDPDGLFPDKPGEWKYDANTARVSEIGLGSTAARELAAKMEGVMAVLAESPVFHPPLGFQARARTQYNGRVCANGGSSGMCSDGPADAYNDITFYYFLDTGGGKASWGGEANSSVRLAINDVAAALGTLTTGDAFLPDGRPIVLCPKEVGRLNGFPLLESVHGGWALTLTRPGVPVWVPVSRQQYLEALIRSREKSLPAIQADSERASDPYAAWLAERPKREKEIRDSYEAIRRTDPAQAEQFLQMSQKIEAETGAQLQRMGAAPADPSGTKPLQTSLESLREQLEGLSAEERALPAFYIRPDESRDGAFASGLVSEGTPGSIQLVAVNPQLVDRRRPPQEIQLITVTPLLDGSRVSNQRVIEFIHSVDWSRVASFLR